MPRPPQRPPSSAGGLSEQQLLKLILQLDDPALTWLCDQLLLLCPSKLKSQNERAAEKQLPQLELNNIEDCSVETAHNEKQNEESFVPLGDERNLARPAMRKQLSVVQVTAGEEKAADNREAALESLIEEEGYDKDLMCKPSDELAQEIKQRVAARLREDHGDTPDDLLPTVAFESAIHNCYEDSGSVDVGVIRIGPKRACQQRSEVNYCTRDASAIAGRRYKAVAGKLVFEAGERRKIINVPVIASDHWDCTLEFEVELQKEGAKSARLSRYAHKTRVKILDNDTFPTGKFQEELRSEEGAHHVNQLLLMIEYFRMNMMNPIIRLGIIKTLLADTLKNISFVVDLFLDMWMVDYVLCSDESQCPPDTALSSLLLVVLLKVGHFPLEHYLRYRSNFWKVGGESRMTLQGNLLRKYLAYDETSLNTVNSSRLILAITRDSEELVSSGFCQLPKIVFYLVRLTFIVLYQLLVPVALGETLSVDIVAQRLIPVLVFPIAISIFVVVRHGTTMKYMDAQHEALNGMVWEIQDTIVNSRLIQDYRKRGVFIDRFTKTISALNTASVNLSASITNNEHFTHWCTIVVLSVYIPLAGMRVVSGETAVYGEGGFLLGTFLNNLTIIKALGALFEQLYVVILEMIEAFEPLSTVVHFMNLPTDSELRALQQQDEVLACRIRVQQNIEEDGDRCPIDGLCIEMRDLSFMYNKKGDIGSELRPSTCVLPQGGLYTFVGPPSEGKGTILKLLGGALLPHRPGFERSAAGGEGTLMIPSHLRVLHVSKDPMFTRDTLLENLTFGCVKNIGDDNIERVLGICKECAVSEVLLKTIKDNQLSGEWLDMLSGTEAACLHIARALIANPEVLVIHKPALFLNTEMADMMYNLLQKFVHQRGLGMSSKDLHGRRPRTCIISARRVAGAGAQVADAVFLYSSNTGLTHLKM